MNWGRSSFDDSDLVPTEQLSGLRRDELANAVDEFAEPGRVDKKRAERLLLTLADAGESAGHGK